MSFEIAQRCGISLLTAAAVGGLGAGIAHAQSTSAGFAGSGTLTVRTAISGTPVRATGRVRMEERDGEYRFDLLSLNVPPDERNRTTPSGTDVASLVPPGGLTAIYDPRGSRVTVWSSARRSYTVVRLPERAVGDSTVTGAPAGDAASLLALLGDPRRLQLSVEPQGETTVDGRSATDYAYRVQRSDGESSTDFRVSGRAAMANDASDVFPIALTANVSGPNVTGSLRLALPNLRPSTPPASDFTVPSGYTEERDVGGVVSPERHR